MISRYERADHRARARRLVDFRAGRSADTGDPGHPVLRWSVRGPRRRDFWGHPVIPSWYTETTVVLDLDGRLRPLLAEKQPAEVRVGADGFTR